GQLLPRLRLRRPLAPVLVLVRAQPTLEPVLLEPAGDLGVPARVRAPLRDRAAPAPGSRGAPGQLGRAAAALARGDLARRLDRRGPGGGRRPAERAGDPGPSRP